MEEEAEKLKEMQKQVEESIMSPTAGQSTCKMKRLLLFTVDKFGYNNCTLELIISSNVRLIVCQISFKSEALKPGSHLRRMHN